jgi:hypothetical protein
MPSQPASVLAGAPDWQLSISCPATQLVAPLALQAPMPQLVAALVKSSSMTPSQSSSWPSHVLSTDAVGRHASGGFAELQSSGPTLTPPAAVHSINSAAPSKLSSAPSSRIPLWLSVSFLSSQPSSGESPASAHATSRVTSSSSVPA